MALVTIQRSPSPSNSPESEDDIDANSSRQRSFSENYFTVKGAALILPQSECSQRSPQSNGGDIQQHLQQMIYLLRPEDTIKVAVKLESAYEIPLASRYMVVVCCLGKLDTEESIMLGIDMKDKEASIGLVLPIWANSKITLDGDGGFGVNSEGADYLFKPVSVQAMWSALQSLHKVINTANVHDYIPKGLTHTWVGYYKARITSDLSCIKEWNKMDDIESFAADSPYSTEKPELDPNGMKTKISVKLKEIMMSKDLEETTCKELRNMLEESFNRSLKDYKSFIDAETIRILRQMDAPTEIFPYLYLGSEWNASNYEELEENGVTSILNISREIDNFFPEKFIYMNVREFDNEFTDLMKHWKRTHEFIRKTKEDNGKVLVHCKMGISRSASTVIAFKMKEDCCTFKEAFDFVKEKRGVIKPNKAFITQLKEYHGILTASQKRHMFNTKSKSEEGDTRNGAASSHFDNDLDYMQRNFDNSEYMDVPGFYRDDYFLPIRPRRDSDGFTSDSVDDRSDNNESEVVRVRANTYDCANLQIPKFKADNSWISSQPFSIGESSTDPDDKDPTLENDIKGLIQADISNTQTILNQNLPLNRTSVNINVSGSLNVERTSHCENNSNSSSMRGSAKGLKMMASDIKGAPLQQIAKADTADQSSEVPEPYVKESIPWNPGTVRQQWRNLEERIKSNTKTPSETEPVDEDIPFAADAVNSLPTATVSSPLTASEACQSSESDFNSSQTIWMSRFPLVLKSSHTISTFPVNKENEAVTMGRENEFDIRALHRVVERPQSVCDDVLGKEFFNSLSIKENLTADKEGCFPAVYKMEDIDFPVGTVRRTTQELEQKHRSSCHDLTTLGMPPSETKIQPVQRSSSLGSERDRPRLERTKWREVCTPILSPRNMVPTSSVDFKELDLGVQIEGGSVRMKTINFETLGKEDDDLPCQDRLLVVPQRIDQTADSHVIGTQQGVTVTNSSVPCSAPAVRTETLNLIGKTASVEDTTYNSATSSTPSVSVAHLQSFSGNKTKVESEEGKSPLSKQHKVSPKILINRESQELPKKPQTNAESVDTALPHSTKTSSLFTESLSKFSKETEKQTEELQPKHSENDASTITRQASFPSSNLDTTPLPQTSSVKTLATEQQQISSNVAVFAREAQLSENICTSTLDINLTIPERTAELEKNQFLKTKSLDESTLSDVTADGSGKGNKIVRDLIGKFDSNLTSEPAGSTAIQHKSETDKAAVEPFEPVTTAMSSHCTAGRGSQFQSSQSESESTVKCNSSTQPVGLPLPHSATVSTRNQLLSSSSSSAAPTAISDLSAASEKNLPIANVLSGAKPVDASSCGSQPNLGDPSSSLTHIAPSTSPLQTTITTTTTTTTTAAAAAAAATITTTTAISSPTSTVTSTSSVSCAFPLSSSSSSSSTSAGWRIPTLSPSALQESRKVRKLQGKTHPLSKLESRQYSQNPSFYSTM
ncbi:serine-rich adhesin for platelets isoform X2 [Octopus bimaculoides]|uniref:serine-rich adhesin for platelets isoform X2 n=1 Tax=Octopus bimaculoides TaxID=37653 RepID=UPI0022E406DF|nr:serine-rich adhesin for platelets isoform X2 [Octopus bimaculoides]